jgi:hypothetical protein
MLHLPHLLGIDFSVYQQGIISCIISKSGMFNMEGICNLYWHVNAFCTVSQHCEIDNKSNI